MNNHEYAAVEGKTIAESQNFGASTHFVENLTGGQYQTCNIGYWLGESHIKKGYMEESMRSIIPYIFKNLKINRIQALTLENNFSSRKLLEKIGFKNEGVLRKAMKINNIWEDHILYALLNNDNS